MTRTLEDAATLDLRAVADIDRALPPHRRARVGLQVWAARHGRSIALLLPLLALVGTVHTIGMSTFPSRNGAGPPPDEPDRDDEWCNPARQALGEPPRPVTDRPGLAALLWIKDPGESDGKCGGERTYLFSPNQARTLVAGGAWLPAGERAAAKAARPAPVIDAG
ncbi:glycoside hydrolase family 6 protein [Micromonospora sp. RTP1Z1]|uniref:glycoside hydrolase family 6 protein n=1 Tax=Micromonospora sp. RTP1Z1 TaxID=2994043 RepID=UPI0029C60E39|nr:glycoside hydrolase family 6 protein [Micromonospora sp. RTP1Z1]